MEKYQSDAASHTTVPEATLDLGGVDESCSHPAMYSHYHDTKSPLSPHFVAMTIVGGRPYQIHFETITPKPTTLIARLT